MDNGFGDDFIWGAATAAHQIEGNNVNSDWWVREHTDSGIEEPSGDAADSYHRFPEDIALLAASGLSTYRFSLEWARIEPAEGEFSRAELAHYRRVIDTCLEYGVTPLITLHHFTSPRWFADDGGWSDERSVERFARYVEAVLPLLDRASHVITINEPNMLAMMAGFGTGGEQIQAGSLPEPDPVATRFIIDAHKRAVDLVRTTGVPVGWSVAPQQFYADPGAEEVLRAYAYPRETIFLEAARGDDFVAVQAYTRTRITADGPLPAPDDVEQTLTGWEYYPPAIAEAARLGHAITRLPVLVSENGIATADDSRRIDYTRDALRALRAEKDAGLPLFGYLHWSLLDNYEWGSYKPTFGLISWDPETFDRTPKPSLRWLGDVATGAASLDA